MRSKYIILACWAVVLTACTVRPNHILSNSEMRELLIDMHRTDGVVEVERFQYEEKGKTEDWCYQHVLEKHGISQATFDSSLVWYTAYPSQFERIYERVFDELKHEENRLIALIEYEKGIIREPLQLDFLDSTVVSRYPYRAQKPYDQFIDALLDTLVLEPRVWKVETYVLPISANDSSWVDPNTVETKILPTIPKLKTLKINEDLRQTTLPQKEKTLQKLQPRKKER